MVDRYEGAKHIYGENGFEKIANAKILAVGAGGIGCEVRKFTFSLVRDIIHAC